MGGDLKSTLDKWVKLLSWLPHPYNLVDHLLKFSFSRTKEHMTLKHEMLHNELWPIVVYSNDDLGLTLTYFAAKSNFVPYAFKLGKSMCIIHQTKTCSTIEGYAALFIFTGVVRSETQ